MRLILYFASGANCGIAALANNEMKVEESSVFVSRCCFDDWWQRGPRKQREAAIQKDGKVAMCFLLMT
jgi:hypothetical protein